MGSFSSLGELTL